jgi:hypothetical protein
VWGSCVCEKKDLHKEREGERERGREGERGRGREGGREISYATLHNYIWEGGRSNMQLDLIPFVQLAKASGALQARKHKATFI